jgi:hypothetical protein
LYPSLNFSAFDAVAAALFVAFEEKLILFCFG